ncbi:cysteine hydrolase family protein [Lysobacter cavernae]|uniref:Cysteine hydrolase family protein n=1 Tax=Lysobacter cavernae TaxID=1685901 RepID=A0ABV7RT83_9GAMM
MKIVPSLIAALAITATSIAGASTSGPHPTIRSMAGAVIADHIDPKATALIVIDFQNEYFTGAMPISDGAAALANTRRLITFADKADIPVYHVQHVAPAGSPVFAIDGETVKFHPDMQPRPGDAVVQKQTVSVFAGTDLAEQLKTVHIKTVIIAGLMTHACVAGAARDAVPNGLQVIVASDASATRTITRANGDTIDQDTLHRSSLAEIEDTFGDVLTVSQIVSLPLR